MKGTVTLESLEAKGFKVFLKHAKREDGGVTTKVAIYDEPNKKVYFSEAKCHPTDQFSRKKGRIIALGRAMNPRTGDRLDTTGWSEERLKEFLVQVVYG